MTGWLIYEKNAADYNRSYIEHYISEGKKLGITILLLYYEQLQFGTKKNQYSIQYNGNDIIYPDFVICRVREPLFSKQLEYMNIPVFNNSKVSELCNDKAKTYQYLMQTNIRMVDTLFVKNEYLYDSLVSCKEKVIVKAVAGHGGNQVMLYEPTWEEEQRDTDIQAILEKMNGEDVVLQHYLKGRGQDLRVYIIGGQVVASVLRTSSGDFRANYSLGGSVCLYELSKEERQLVEKICDQFDFDLVGIDFLIDEDGTLVFNEIEDVVGSRMLYQTSDIDIVTLYLDYIKSKIDDK